MKNIRMCIFDFDNTLVHTDHPVLNRIRPSLVRKSNTEELKNFVINHNNFVHLNIEFFYYLRKKFPDLKLGIFTKAPISYIRFMLNYFYPNFLWDSIVAYENTPGQYKPNPYGLRITMNKFNISDPSQLIYIGDDLRDQKTAINCKCHFVPFDLRNVGKCYQDLLQNVS